MKYNFFMKRKNEKLKVFLFSSIILLFNQIEKKINFKISLIQYFIKLKSFLAKNCESFLRVLKTFEYFSLHKLFFACANKNMNIL